MLKSVKISNFGPINEEITFTMEKGKTEQFPENVIEGTALLKTVLIYGKNNSGKSRFINAFSLLNKLIVEGKKTFENPDFSANHWNMSYISSFDFEFLIEDYLYKYNLEIDLIDEKVHLESLEVDGAPIFFRQEGKVITRENFKKYFINNKINNEEGKLLLHDIESIKKLFDDISTEFNEINEEISYITFHFNKLKESKEIDKFYRYIDKIFFIDQQRKSEGDYFYAGIDSSLIEYVEKNSYEVNNIIKKFGFDFDIIVKEERYGRKMEKVIEVIKKCKQNKENYSFNILATESFGTITFLKLILMALSQSDRSFIMIIDEIERGVHPLLVANFIKYMNKYFPNVQLILPTHMTDLLSTDLNLRKDQIYITDITDGKFSIKRNFNKKHIRENMNFQKILKSNSVGGNPEINIDYENEEI